MAIDYEKLGLFYLGTELNPQTLEKTDDYFVYESKELTTHAICVGMTGSGKTGLCLTALEEAAIDGIPIIAIDPKGDLANLALTFPNLSESDLAPWVAGQNVSEVISKIEKGLTSSGQSKDRIRKFKESTEVAIYTPRSTLGRPLSFLKSLNPPAEAIRNDNELYATTLQATTLGLLTLLGQNISENDPQAALISALIDYSWREGRSIGFVELIRMIQTPPMAQIGVMNLEDFFPKNERTKFALQFNAVISSPTFALWSQGENLSIQDLLWTSEGKSRISVINIAHLPDSERMFVVTRILNELVSWMRSQSGTDSLRALFFMDEIFGYFPPTANPPSKLPFLTLMKQARAYGLGMMLATQNPVDLDYKGISNAGTWFIGRLQTDQDRERLIDGLMQTGASINKTEVQKQLSQLPSRTFWVRNVHDQTPHIIQTRWALSYMAGPLSGEQIKKLSPTVKSLAQTSTLGFSASSVDKPILPSFIKPRYIFHADSSRNRVNPCLLGVARIFMKHSESGGSWEEKRMFVAPVSQDTDDPWESARELPATKVETAAAQDFSGNYGELSAKLQSKDTFDRWCKLFSDYIFRSVSVEIYVNEAFKYYSKPQETEQDFRARLTHMVREKRDQEVAKLKATYETKLKSLEAKLDKAHERIDREKSQATQTSIGAAVSLGATLLGAILGGKRSRSSLGTIQRASTTLGRASRTMKERQDVNLANQSANELEMELQALQEKSEGEIAALTATYDPTTLRLEKKVLTPKKQDITVLDVGFVWLGE